MSSTEIDRPRRVSIGELRQTELIEATIEIVAKQGFENTTIRDIAQAANASPGSVHYYFDNKTELLRAAMVHCDTRFRIEIKDRIRTVEGAVKKLFAVFDLCFPDDGGRDTVLNVVIDFWQQAARRSDFRSLFDKAHGEWVRDLAEIFEDGKNSGELSFDAPAEHEALALAALVDGLSLYSLVTNQMNASKAREILCGRVDELRPPGSE